MRDIPSNSVYHSAFEETGQLRIVCDQRTLVSGPPPKNGGTNGPTHGLLAPGVRASIGVGNRHVKDSPYASAQRRLNF